MGRVPTLAQIRRACREVHGRKPTDEEIWLAYCAALDRLDAAKSANEVKELKVGPKA